MLDFPHLLFVTFRQSNRRNFFNKEYRRILGNRFKNCRILANEELPAACFGV